MFFKISQNQDLLFPNNYKLGKYWFSCDNGWTKITKDQKNYFIKGYIDDFSSHEQIINQFDSLEPGSSGNFALICFDQDLVTVTHNKLRSFPLWASTDEVTNMYQTGESIWADCYLVIDNWQINKQIITPYTKEPLTEIDIETGVERIKNILIDKTKSLHSCKLDIKLFLSGGVDTMLLYALLKHQKIDHELIDYFHQDKDEFLCKNYQQIEKQHWGYTQIHHWKNPVLFPTGSCGDEYFLRGPYTAGVWASWHEFDVIDILKKDTVGFYHRDYFLGNSNRLAFETAKQDAKNIKTKHELNYSLINNLVNDHQHWHYGNTITWTPFHDIDILKIVLSINPDQLLYQTLDAKLNKMLIEQLYPDLLNYVSTQKNINNMQNIYKLF